MKSSGYWKNMLHVSLGTVFAQGIGVLGYVLLARIYAAEAFGVYASWVALISIISVIITGAFETSFVLEDDGDHRRVAVVKTLVTASLAAVITFLVLFTLSSFIPNVRVGIHEWPSISTSLGGLALAACAVFQSWAAASGHFSNLNRLRVLQSSAITTIPFLFGLYQPTADNLILGHLIGLIVTSVGWGLVFKPDRSVFCTLTEVRAYWKERKRCLIYVLPALSLGVVTANLPVLAVRARFGEANAGLLALAVRVLGAPTSLVGVAIRDVFKRHASLAYRERGECRAEFKNTLYVLGLFSAVFCIVILMSADFLFLTVFGQEWRPAGTIAIWLLPMFTISIVASPLSYLVYIVQREDVDFRCQLILAVLVGMALMLMPTFQSAMLAYCSAYVVIYLAYLILCYSYSAGNGIPDEKFKQNSLH